MARNVYTKSTRDSFMRAANDARANGKTWMEAYDAAKAAGYEGSLQGISKMARSSDEPRKAKSKRGKRRVGRPRKSHIVSTPSYGLDALQRTIHGLVEQRVRAALDHAIGALKSIQNESR